MTEPLTPVWATPLDVETITGTTVNADEIERASVVIDAATGAGDLDVDKLPRRDRRMLRLATAYQTVWMKEQFDLLARHDATSLSQEGSNVSARDSMTFVLAPLAKHALNRCTWAGIKSRQVGRAGSGTVIDPTISDDHRWVRG